MHYNEDFCHNYILNSCSLTLLSVYKARRTGPNILEFTPNANPDYFGAIVVLEGNATVYYTDNSIQKITKGNLLFINYSEIIKIIVESGVFLHHIYWFNFIGFTLPRKPINIDISNENEHMSLILFHLKKGIPTSIYYANSLMLTHILSWLNDYETSEEEKKYPVTIIKALSYIKTNLKNSIKLKSLSQMVGYSDRQLRTLFLKYLGTTPKQYITDERIKRAKAYLSNTQLSLKNISDSLGFYSEFHFMKSFKKITGYTATEYRKQYSIFNTPQ